MALLDPENKLAQITWDTRLAIKRLAAAAPDLTLRVRSARRSCQEQRELYSIGRSYRLDSRPVTYAQGCRSWHVLGRAVDLDVLSATTGRPVAYCGPYSRLGALWKAMGGGWGGDWRGFGECGDQGHFQWPAGRKMVDECPAPAACEAASARVDAQLVMPRPWLSAAAGVAVGVALGAGVGLLLG